jgi:hypothetical protein
MCSTDTSVSMVYHTEVLSQKSLSYLECTVTKLSLAWKIAVFSLLVLQFFQITLESVPYGRKVARI